MTDDSITIFPTHACFDDAVEYIEAIARDGVSLEELVLHFVVHGIVIAPHGDRYAHAWVEYRDERIQAGLYQGERVWMKATPEEFAAMFNVARSTRYTVLDVVRLQRELGPGPWDPEYKAACSSEKRTWEAPKVTG